ncbi:hypothetical protein [Streptomyces violascens]|uniref:Uncharacterized protein n=1 Tax=Streptomyces violascens TaxID=67381 RepID=A0ABQ3R267_9ACTN|nr:hypothetical protein [Streptomyces violascens]GGU32320.1 hypothetical protein GCM10010289_61960 [Streptomyces violascens]GHI43621.1 hypothetical protein Sviol_80290 [Streptomyces violascens]
MISEVITSVTGATVTPLARWVRKLWQRRSPLMVVATPRIPKAWKLALPDTEPLHAPVPLTHSERRYRQMYEWLRAKGAYDYGLTSLDLRLENRSGEPLIITDIGVHKLTAGVPLRAALVSYPPAGAVQKELIYFDLDEVDPTGRPARFDMDRLEPIGEQPYFLDRDVKLGAGESQTFHIAGAALRSRVSWELSVTILQAGKYQKIIVQPGSGPLRTSGTPTQGFDGEWIWNWFAGEAASFTPAPHPTA